MPYHVRVLKGTLLFCGFAKLKVKQHLVYRSDRISVEDLMFSYVNIDITFRYIRNEADWVCERRREGGHHGVITEGQKSLLVSEHIFGCSVFGFKSWLCYIAAV